MGRSIALQKAYDAADVYDATLRADDKRFRNHVMAIEVHGQPTVLHYSSAFVLEDKEWYYVFTEHRGFHVFAKDEVRCIQLKSTPIKKF